MTLRTLHATLIVSICMICFASSILAQDASFDTHTDALPDAPSPTIPSTQAPSLTGKHAVREHETSRFDALIDPSEVAPRLTAFDKVGMGIKQSVSPFALLGWVASATYGEAFDKSPNYGQNGKAYLRRLGASAAKASSETIFSTSVIAPILHEDPRYYVLGPGHNGFRRTTHALGAIFLTPTDKGGTSVNYALLGGNLAGSALTQAYYPTENRGATEVLTTFGTSLAGSAVKYLFDEFFYNQAHITQLAHKVHM